VVELVDLLRLLGDGACRARHFRRRRRDLAAVRQLARRNLRSQSAAKSESVLRPAIVTRSAGATPVA
jgi:hypothetical protein